VTHGRRVQVLFLDARSGDEIARVEVPADRLPAVFRPQATTVELDGASWTVEDADPSAPGAVPDAGTLRLRVRPAVPVDPAEILYSLPTITDRLPTPEGPDHRTAVGPHVLHEDDWRQVEFVDARLMDVVAAELGQVRDVRERSVRRDGAGRLVGFNAIHVRAEPADPLPARPAADRLLAVLGEGPQRPLGFFGEPGTVPGSFALPLGPVVAYGVVDDDGVAVCGLDPAPDAHQEARPDHDLAEAAGRLARCLADFDLLLVDWCRAVMVPADAVHTYLEAAHPEAGYPTDGPAGLAMGT
jgi:hypothetical protein